MKVRELIKKLAELDPELPVGRFIEAHRDGPPEFCEYKKLTTDTKRVYNTKAKESNTYHNVTGVEIK